jgi:monofunctional glycosyltransferase
MTAKEKRQNSQGRAKALIQTVGKWRWRIVKYTCFAYIVGIPLYTELCKFVLPPITEPQLESLLQHQSSFRRAYVPLEEISPYVVIAVIAAEDGKFARHEGFDWDGIKEAWAKQRGGGSTITQQTAKNVFLTLDSNWLRKILEVYPTWWIEKLWGKRRILEVYLNVIEFDRGVWGVEAAAQKYFDRSASQLTRSQAAWLALCLPNPKDCLSDRRKSGRLNAAHKKVLKEMNYVQQLKEVRQILGEDYLKAIEK